MGKTARLLESDVRKIWVWTDLGAHDIVVDNIDQVEEQAGIGIPACNVNETARQPVADAGEALGTSAQEQELLEKGIGQDGHELRRQFQFIQVLDKGLGVFYLLESNRVLGFVSFRGQAGGVASLTS